MAKTKAKLIPAYGGGKEDRPQKLWEVMLFNAISMAEVENALAFREAWPDRDAEFSDDAAELVKQPSPRAFLASEREYVRDEIGRFGEGDGTGATKVLDARADELTRLATSKDWGDPDPDYEAIGMRWGSNARGISDEWNEAHSEAVDLVGTDMTQVVENWSQGWGVGQVRDAYDDYRASGTAMPPGAPDDDTVTYSRGADDLFEMLDANRIDAELYRGTMVRANYLDEIEALKVGDTVPDGLASWSRDPEVADVFKGAAGGSSYMLDSEQAYVELTLAPGAHGVDIAVLGEETFGWQEEVMVGGELIVTSIEVTKPPPDTDPDTRHIPTYHIGMKAAT